MTLRPLTTSLIALSLALGPAVPAMAGGGDALVGGIIGGLIGGAIAKEAGKKKVVKTYRAPAPDPARETRREVQTSLNYFGFDAGTPDGVYGRNTRLAVSRFQSALGYPVTGELTAFEQDFLVSSWKRAELGGANTLALIAQNPQGATGLLVAWRDEMVGGSVGGSGQMAAAPAPAVPAPVAPQAVGATPQPGTLAPQPGSGVVEAQLPVVGGGNAAQMSLAPAAQPPAPQAPALPTFLAGAPAQPSLTSHCNQVSMVTGTNGGFATLASMTDPGQALDEQFCLARTYAITAGEQLAAGVQGVTPAQLADQCAAFGPVMAPAVALLPSAPPAEVIGAAAQIGAGTGMDKAQLAGTARICLSAGYRTDSMPVALGSALLLTALGETPYAELVGQHLLEGFGATASPNLAKEWFRLGLDALAAGQPPVFAPGQPERVELVRALVLGEMPQAMPVPASGGAIGNRAANAPRMNN